MGFEPTNPYGQGISSSFNLDDIRQFLFYLGGEYKNGKLVSRDEQKIRTNTLNDYRKRLNKFYEITQGNLNPQAILKFVTFAQGKDLPHKYLDIARRFIEWLGEVRREDYNNLIKLLRQVKRKKRVKKTYADEGSIFDVSLEDIHQHIRKIAESNLNMVSKLRAIVASALSASTGLRPEELTKLERKDIDLNKDYFILPSTKSKTHIERVIPLHPQVKELLKIYLNVCDNEELFSYGALRYAFEQADAPLRLKQFRKFFAIHSAKIRFPEVYRIAIAGHDTEELEKALGTLTLKITEEFYRKFTPDCIAEEYMKYWGKVEIIHPVDFARIVDTFPLWEV